MHPEPFEIKVLGEDGVIVIDGETIEIGDEAIVLSEALTNPLFMHLPKSHKDFNFDFDHEYKYVIPDIKKDLFHLQEELSETMPKHLEEARQAYEHALRNIELEEINKEEIERAMRHAKREMERANQEMRRAKRDGNLS